MSQLVRLLAVPHQIQGRGFRGYIEDPSYLQLVRDLIRDDVDFVFEEAAGHSPSIAEELTHSLLGPSHYADMDPSRSTRLKLGIAETLSGLPIDPFNSNDMYTCHSIIEHEKREKLWLQKIGMQPFKRGLVICGLAHILSFAFRLQNSKVDVEVYDYLPYNKLCTRSHQE